jgi:hypothetical protein
MSEAELKDEDFRAYLASSSGDEEEDGDAEGGVQAATGGDSELQVTSFDLYYSIFF